MSMNSINTNYGSFVALQNLTETTRALRQTEDRISTGRTINSSRDNGAIWAIAQNLRAGSLSINAVRGSLDRAQSAKLGMKPRSSRTCCSPTQRVGMTRPVDRVRVFP